MVSSSGIRILARKNIIHGFFLISTVNENFCVPCPLNIVDTYSPIAATSYSGTVPM